MKFKKYLVLALSLVMAMTGSISGYAYEGEAIVESGYKAADSSYMRAYGANETLCAFAAGINKADIKEVSYSQEGAEKTVLSGDDFTYLVRDKIENDETGVRIDIPGLKSGNYDISVIMKNDDEYKAEALRVKAYDRSGYAHFNYTEGVGAYNDDGTLKKDAVVLYVTEENKNSVELTYAGKTVKGIGNILNSAGAKGNSKGLANTNDGILESLAKDGTALCVRIVGKVTNLTDTTDPSSKALIDGISAYASTDFGGSDKDNGGMVNLKKSSNVTIEGIGTDAACDGWGFHFVRSTKEAYDGKNFELRNIIFRNTPEDAVGMEGYQAADAPEAELDKPVEHCWIHNNEFYVPAFKLAAEDDKKEGDGSCDFKRGQYLTVAYNYFSGCHKTCLVGGGDKNIQYNLTYHHNYWKGCNQRGPLTRRANVHMYNNLIEGQTGYAMNTRAEAYIFSEYNTFRKCLNPQKVEPQTDAGAIKSFNDIFDGCTGQKGTVVDAKDAYVKNNCAYIFGSIDYSKFETDSSLSYIPDSKYLLETDMEKAEANVKSNSGVINVNYPDEVIVKKNGSKDPGSGGEPVSGLDGIAIAETARISSEIAAATSDENKKKPNPVYVDVLEKATDTIRLSQMYVKAKYKGLVLDADDTFEGVMTINPGAAVTIKGTNIITSGKTATVFTVSDAKYLSDGSPVSQAAKKKIDKCVNKKGIMKPAVISETVNGTKEIRDYSFVLSYTDTNGKEHHINVRVEYPRFVISANSKEQKVTAQSECSYIPALYYVNTQKAALAAGKTTELKKGSAAAFGTVAVSTNNKEITAAPAMDLTKKSKVKLQMVLNGVKYSNVATFTFEP